MTQTISQALRRIKKLKGLISEYQARTAANVSYDKKKPPVFPFKTDMENLSNYKAEFLELEGQVAVANATHEISYQNKNLNLSVAIRVLQELKGWITFYKGLNLKNEVVRDKEQYYDEEKEKYLYNITETEFVSDLSEIEREAKVKSLQDEFEILNNIVEDANHKIVI